MSEISFLITKLDVFKTATQTLTVALEEAKNELEKDGAIKRFEYCFELAWKTIKLFLTYEGIDASNSPRAVFKDAFLAGYLENEKAWIDMIDDRNLIIHTYDQQKSELLFQQLSKYDKEFKVLIQHLEKVIERYE